MEMQGVSLTAFHEDGAAGFHWTARPGRAGHASPACVAVAPAPSAAPDLARAQQILVEQMGMNIKNE